MDNPKAAIVAIGDEAVARHRQGWPAAPAPGLMLPDDVVFGADGNSLPVQGQGWSAPESGYTWSIGAQCTLALRRVTPAPMRLEIELAPFAAPPRLPGQRLVLYANGLLFGDLYLTDISVVAIPIPALPVGSVDVLALSFDMPDAERPCDITGVPDDRRLGFSFRRLRLEPAIVTDAVLAFVVGQDDVSGLVLRELMLGFESLGENCEFGLVQRRCGAEPLGLLRFASAPLPRLLAALGDRFAGVGQASNVEIKKYDNSPEFLVEDRAFGFLYHSWIAVDSMTADALHSRECRRLPFLADKLIDDLTEGEKTFVFHAMDEVSPEAVVRLADAMAAYGKARLLWVRLAEPGEPVGSVRVIRENLWVGTVDRFAPAENASDFSFSAWISLCLSARRLAERQSQT